MQTTTLQIKQDPANKFYYLAEIDDAFPYSGYMTLTEAQDALQNGFGDVDTLESDDE